MSPTSRLPVASQKMCLINNVDQSVTFSHEQNCCTVPDGVRQPQRQSSLTGTKRRLPPKYFENTFQAIQRTFRTLESKCFLRALKNNFCIYSAILRELEAYRNYQGFSLIFLKFLDAIERFTKVRIFLILLYIAFLSLKILDFLFTTKKNLTWRVKCEKSNFGKSWRIYWKSSSKIVHEWNGHLEIFQPSSSNRKFQAIFTSLNRYFKENSRWVPLKPVYIVETLIK